jgi:hypothetical protein
MMVRGAIASRGDPDTIHDGDLVLLWDAKRHGNENALMKAFTKSDGRTMKKEKTLTFVHFEEDSLKARRCAVRGVGTIQQTEFLWVVAHSAMLGPERARKHFSGTTHGDTLGPVKLPASADLWHLSVADKKKLYGSARMEVGGVTPGAEGPAPVRKPESLEPVGFHTKPEKLWDELDHSYNVRAWIDLTCLDEALALMCVKKRKPYMGFCLTEFHLQMLSQKLVMKIFASFLQENDPLFQADLAAHIKPASRGGAAGAQGKRPTSKLGEEGAVKRRKRTPKSKDDQRKALQNRLQRLGGGKDQEDEEEEGKEEAEEEEPVDSQDE